MAMDNMPSQADVNADKIGIDSHQLKVAGQAPVLSPKEVVHKLPESNSSKMKSIVIGLVVVLIGVGTGYLLSGASAKESGPVPTSNIAEGSKTAAVDESSLSEPEVGILNEGGIEGEGTHYLDRGAGADKYIYLLSTVLNLDSFVGKKVEIRGHTLGAEKARWLMDVGRIKEVK